MTECQISIIVQPAISEAAGAAHGAGGAPRIPCAGQLEYNIEIWAWRFYQTLIIEGQQRMINNRGEGELRKPSHQTYRPESDHSPLGRPRDRGTEAALQSPRAVARAGMPGVGFPEQLDGRSSGGPHKNVGSNLDENSANWPTRTLLGKANGAENIVSSCYFQSERQPLGASRWQNANWTGNLTDPHPAAQTLYYHNPKPLKRHSQYSTTTPANGWYPSSSDGPAPSYPLSSFASTHKQQPKNQYSAFELGGSKNDVLTRSFKSKTPCEKSKNSSFFWKEGENHRTPAFPYTSSVTPTEGRSGFMAESLGGAKFKQLYETYKSELHPHRKSNQNLALPKPDKPRSRPSVPREPRLADFTIGECKGEGRFGKVYMAVHKQTGFLCALKKVKKDSVRYMVDQFIQQLKIQLFLNHPKLVKLYGYFSDAEHIYMLIEYMEDGSLYALMKRSKRIEEPEAIEKLSEICQGVKEMHDRSIVHRDLKPENVVMSHGVCKVCDFGWAAICEDRRQTYCGTLDYVCPEIVEGNSYDSGVDVWCVGVLAYELMCGKAPFYDISRKKTIEKIKTCKIQSFPAHLSREAVKFISMILTKDPDDRIGIQELLDSEFLSANKDK